MKTQIKNRGVGDGSGRWLFEDFLLSDGRYGKFVVDYRPVWIDMADVPEWPARYSLEVECVHVLWKESRLFGYHGDEQHIDFYMPSSGIGKEVIEAFKDQLDEVELHEREYR